MCHTEVADVTIQDEEEFLGTIITGKSTPWRKGIKMNNVEIKFKIDTGADVTCISREQFDKLTGVKLQRNDKTLCGPSNSKLHVFGKFQCTLESNNKICVQDVYVVRGLTEALLGRPAIQELEILQQVNVSALSASERYRKKFPKLFNGLGKTDWEYKISLDSQAKPYSITVPRRVPIPLMPKLKAELERMQNKGVISKVDEPTEWCSPMVCVPKLNGDVRICVDLTKLNQSVKREKHPLPSVEESLSKLAVGRWFSKIDCASGFWQIGLAEESRHLTTFITPFGRFLFNRLPMGISSASEYFQKIMTELLDGLPGVICQMDDVLIFGSTQEEHNARLSSVFERMEKVGLTLNEKCLFCQPSLTFLGHVVGQGTIKADPSKVKAIDEMPIPHNVSDIRRFLGMVNQLAKFLPNMAEETQPLRELLKAKSIWLWGPMQEKAFRKIKLLLSTPKVLAHYDPNREILVSADSSSFGLGAVIRQKHGHTWKPLAYASRSLTETEQRYAQIEKEALGITWACEKFSNFLIGTHFVVETDHKPLVPLLGTKDLSDLPPRIQRFRIRLMRFHFRIGHIPGKELVVPDCLSRAPLSGPDKSDNDLLRETNAFVDQVIQSLPASSTRLEQIKAQYGKDEVCRNLMLF